MAWIGRAQIRMMTISVDLVSCSWITGIKRKRKRFSRKWNKKLKCRRISLSNSPNRILTARYATNMHSMLSSAIITNALRCSARSVGSPARLANKIDAPSAESPLSSIPNALTPLKSTKCFCPVRFARRNSFSRKS